MRIIIEDVRDRKWLSEKYHDVKLPYKSKALSFRLNTLLALTIRQDALRLKSAQLVDDTKE